MDWYKPVFTSEDRSDPTLWALVYDLSLGLGGGYSYKDQKELATSSQSIRKNSALLHRAWSGFSARYTEVSKPLMASTQTREEFDDYMWKLVRKAWHSDKSHNLAKDASGAWDRLMELDIKYSSYRVDASGSLNNIEWRRACALDLALATVSSKHLIRILRQAHVRIEQARSASTPVFRLNDDVLTLIFELLAESEAPTKTSIGWIRLGHICNTWRERLLGMPNLWARDAYIFGARIATHDTLRRTGKSLVSITGARLTFGADGKLPLKCEGAVLIRHKKCIETFASMAHRGTIRDLNLIDSTEGLQKLLRILARTPQFNLRTFILRLSSIPAQDNVLNLRFHAATYPNLTHVEFGEAFVPFYLPRLLSLHIVRSATNCMTDEMLDLLLDSLKGCPTLMDLRLQHWLLPSRPITRTVTLPNLDSLCTDDVSLLGRLHLPALKHALIIGPWTGSNGRAALESIFVRYGLPIRSMQLSQRTRTNADVLTLRFGRTSSCPPPEDLPAISSTTTLLRRGPGSYISLSFMVDKRRTTHTLSLLFGEISSLVRGMPNSEAIETLGFDNETRDASFAINEKGRVRNFGALVLPSFPSVRRIELPLRENELDSTFHILASLTYFDNPAKLPLLDCVKFTGPLLVAQKFWELDQAVEVLLSARKSVDGINRIKSLEFDLTMDGTETYGLEPLEAAIRSSVKCVIGSQRAVKFESESLCHRGKTVRLVATILYHYPVPKPTYTA